MRRFEDLDRPEQTRIDELAAQLSHLVEPSSLFRMDARGRRCLLIRMRSVAQQLLERQRWLSDREAAA